jgi:hypothetical protein
MANEIEYDRKYLTPEMAPLGPIDQWTEGEAAAQQVVNRYLEGCWRAAARDARGGALAHPYFVPGGHYDHLWDWDAYFMAEAAWSEELYPYAEGSLFNLLDATDDSGRPPKLVRADGSLDLQHPIPLHAQWMVLVCERRGDWDRAAHYWNRMVAIQRWYDATTLSPSGLYRWISMAGQGFDNHPGVYGRPAGSVIGVDLNSFHVREFAAWERLATEVGRTNPFAGCGRQLRSAMNDRLFDPVDRFYYNVDDGGASAPRTNQAVTWPVHLKFRHISGVLPLWAGVGQSRSSSAGHRRPSARRRGIPFPLRHPLSQQAGAAVQQRADGEPVQLAGAGVGPDDGTHGARAARCRPGCGRE